MYRLKFILSADVLLTIYNSLILLHFNYCHLAWGSNITDITEGHKLHLQQKKAVRIVDHRHFLAHTAGAYAGFLKGGGPTLKFLGYWIYMPRSGMSRAAKLRAFARGVWGHAPPRKFLKMVQFRAF